MIIHLIKINVIMVKDFQLISISLLFFKIIKCIVHYYNVGLIIS